MFSRLTFYNKQLHRLYANVSLKSVQVFGGSKVVAPPFGRSYCGLSHKKNRSTVYILTLKSRTDFLKISTNRILNCFKCSAKSERLLKHGDSIPKEFSLIYKTSFDNYVIYGQRLVTLGLLMLFGTCVTKVYFTVPLILTKVGEQSEQLESDGGGIYVIRNDADFMVFFVSLVVFVAVLKTVVSKLPLRIYNKPDSGEYVAVFTNFAGLSRKFSFVKSDARKLKPSGILPWRDSLFSVNSKKFYLMEHFFRLPADYNALLNL